MRIVTINEMKEIERRADKSGLSYFQMMENAGTEAAKIIFNNTKDFETKIVLICAGKGNNGGDGFVAAKRIKEFGGHPLILLADGSPVTADAKKNFDIALSEGIEVIEFDSSMSKSLILGSDIIVDAVYGTGFHGELKPQIKELFDIINGSDAVKYAIDIPSGINADSCTVADGTFKADYTVAIDSMKNAHISSDTFLYCGRVVCVDIGIPEECHNL